MAYRVNVYFNNEYIASTNIRSSSFINVTRNYGDDAYIADGFTNSTTFTATPASGCEFVKWYYRIGGDSGALQESTANPFYYSGTEEIIIRAVGQPISGGGTGGDEGETQSWTVYNAGSKTSLTGDMQKSLVFIPYRICRYAVSFAYSGTATFYTTGSAVDTYGFLTTSTSFDSANGKPTSSAILVESDSYEGDFNGGDDGLNFSITYSVKAGTQYYIWVREYYGTERGATTLCITSPSESTSPEWSWSDKAYNAFLNNGKTEDVLHTEWNDFVNFVAEKTGYSVSAALMTASDTYLYATQFNAVRYAIGSVNTFQNGTNSIKEHYEDTARWDMLSGEAVKGQYFIDLTNYLNNIKT